jgi:hypothetical protein
MTVLIVINNFVDPAIACFHFQWLNILT